MADGAVLEARGLTKRYGAVLAADQIELTIKRGEILALLGDNGAGKSTLVKMLCGVVSPDDGDIIFDGKKISFDDPKTARDLGIEAIHQDLGLAVDLDIAGNVYLGREIVRRSFLPRRLSVMNHRAMARGATERLQDLPINLPPLSGVAVSTLSGGQRQAIAVARAATWATEVLFMDEPTAALGVEQSRATLELARHLADRGLAIVMITHTLAHVLEYADRVVVLRRGTKVADMPRAEVTQQKIVASIIGADLES
jgi:ABC-type sugar transport system ATPase subunit